MVIAGRTLVAVVQPAIIRSQGRAIQFGRILVRRRAVGLKGLMEGEPGQGARPPLLSRQVRPQQQAPPVSSKDRAPLAPKVQGLAALLLRVLS